MEPEPEPVDLSSLDPTRDAGRFDAAVARVAARALELHRLRRAVVRRGVVGFAVALAAALLLWFTAPRRDAPAPARTSSDILDWAMRDVSANDVLELGGSHAQ